MATTPPPVELADLDSDTQADPDPLGLVTVILKV